MVNLAALSCWGCSRIKKWYLSVSRQLNLDINIFVCDKVMQVAIMFSSGHKAVLCVATIFVTIQLLYCKQVMGENYNFTFVDFQCRCHCIVNVKK